MFEDQSPVFDVPVELQHFVQSHCIDHDGIVGQPSVDWNLKSRKHAFTALSSREKVITHFCFPLIASIPQEARKLRFHEPGSVKGSSEPRPGSSHSNFNLPLKQLLGSLTSGQSLKRYLLAFLRSAINENSNWLELTSGFTM